MSKTAEKPRGTPLVTHREFKLLLKPEKFPNRRALLEFAELLRHTAERLGVRYEPIESVDSQLRIVQFYDTKGQDLRKNKLIFRMRQIRQGGWPDESWELTFKCRAPDYETAANFDTNTTMSQLQKKKFKEELVRGEHPGTMTSIFSNNVIVEYPEVQMEFPLSRLAAALPHLATLGLDMDEPLSIVAGAKVFEIQSQSGDAFVRARGHRHRIVGALGAARPRSLRAARRRVRLLDAHPRQRKRRDRAESGRRLLQGSSSPTARLFERWNDEDGADLRRRGLLTPFERRRGNAI